MKVLNPQYMGYNPLKMKVLGSHGRLVFNSILLMSGEFRLDMTVRTQISSADLAIE